MTSPIDSRHNNTRYFLVIFNKYLSFDTKKKRADIDQRKIFDKITINYYVLEFLNIITAEEHKMIFEQT